jgi:hypothetical protein
MGRRNLNNYGNHTIEARAQEFIDALHALEQGSIDDASRLVMLYAEQAQLHNSRSTTRTASVGNR